MKHFLHILLMLVALTFSCQSETILSTVSKIDEEEMEELLYRHHKENQTADMLWDANALNRWIAGAVLSDIQNILRICNSRPQRILSIYASKTNRIAGKLLLSYKYKPFHFFCRGKKQRPYSALFFTDSPCDYYVFALREIMC